MLKDIVILYLNTVLYSQKYILLIVKIIDIFENF